MGMFYQCQSNITTEQRLSPEGSRNHKGDDVRRLDKIHNIHGTKAHNT